MRSQILKRSNLDTTSTREARFVPPPPAETEVLLPLVASTMNGNGTTRHDGRQPLAVFCYAEPQSLIGREVASTVAALARRHIPVHLFTRHDFTVDAPGVQVHLVGACGAADLVESAQEYARRA